MKSQTLQQAIFEAERFIKSARKAIRRQDEDWAIDKVRLNLTRRDCYENRSKENASCKRASLDLSRIMSELRLGK